MRPRVRRRRDGTYDIRLSPEERSLLASLPAQITPLLHSNDPSVQRVFPPAYGSDQEAEAEYRSMVGSALVAHQVEALSVLETTANSERMTAEQASGWLAALNTLRLVLGTRLDVSEEMAALEDNDPKIQAMALYQWLTWLQEQFVRAMSNSLGES